MSLQLCTLISLAPSTLTLPAASSRMEMLLLLAAGAWSSRSRMFSLYISRNDTRTEMSTLQARALTCSRIRPESGCNARGADLVEDVSQSAGDDALVLLNGRRHANRAHRVRLAAARLPVPAQDVTIIP